MNRDFISGLLKFIVLISMVLALITCKKDETKTTSVAPVAITNSASWPGRHWAVLKGQVNGKDQLTTVTFQYDTYNNLYPYDKPCTGYHFQEY